MPKFSRQILALSFCASLSAGTIAWSANHKQADNSSKAPSKLTSKQMSEALRMETLTIPVPGEYFAAIDKVDRPNWAQVIRPIVLPNTSNRSQLALILGTRVTDGFIAVEAQDAQQVKNIGKDIFNLAKQLGAGQSIVSRSSSISNFAENSEWATLKEELEATQNEVKLTMAGQQDETLVDLITLGAWLRGMQATSEVIEKKYQPQAAKLLRQPGVVDCLALQFNKLPERMRKEKLFAPLQEGLVKIKALMNFGLNEAPTQQMVTDLRTTTARMVEAICSPISATTPTQSVTPAVPAVSAVPSVSPVSSPL